MNKLCTDIEQSKKLIELGIDINTADLVVIDLPMPDGDRFKFIRIKFPNDVFPSITDGKSELIPAWSLAALLELMPRSIKSKKNGQTYLSFHRGYEDKWMFEYSFDDIDRDYLEVMFEQRNPIDAAFETVCWLKENKYI